MANLEWLKTAFSQGYESGEILSEAPDNTRVKEEALIGGSYRDAFRKAVLPFLRPDSKVLELGPGTGSWTRAILKYIPHGRLTALDFIDLRNSLRPDDFDGRLIFHQVTDFSFSSVRDGEFDFLWSFGVLCHHTHSQIGEILTASLPKLKMGGIAVHQYAEWNKLYRSGRWKQFEACVQLPDAESWWPFNTRTAMAATARQAGWDVIVEDLDLFERDGVIMLKRSYET